MSSSIEQSSTDLAQFRLAIESLPAATLRSEIQRLHNSTFHLRRSNAELEAMVAEDEELREYILENEQVINTNGIRINMLEDQLRSVDPNFEPETPISQPEESAVPSTISDVETETMHESVASTSSDLTEATPAANGRLPNGNASSEAHQKTDTDEGVFL